MPIAADLKAPRLSRISLKLSKAFVEEPLIKSKMSLQDFKRSATRRRSTLMATSWRPQVLNENGTNSRRF